MTDSKVIDDYEHVPFLPPSQQASRDSRRKSHSKCMILIHAILIITYTAVFVFGTLQMRLPQKHTYQATTKYTLATESPFAGSRTNQTDQAWSDLLRGINVRVREHELSIAPAGSVELPQGGFLAWPEAMHQIHCVKRIREWFYRDQYHPGLDEQTERHWIVHIDHCIELLRQSVMCNPDKAWMGFHWEASNERPTLNLEGPEHKCVDWDQYIFDVRTRSISQEEMGQLRRPQTVRI